MVTSTGRFLAAGGLVVAAVGTLADYPELLALGVCGVLAVVVARLMLVRRPFVNMVWTVIPLRTTENSDQPVRSVVTLTSRGSRHSPELVVTHPLSTDGPQSVRGLRRSKPHEATSTLPRLPRGVHRLEPALVGRADPLRLVHIARPVGDAKLLYVRPHVHKVPALPNAGPQDAEAPPRMAMPLSGDVFYSLRQYASGDEWRLIHWPATARMGTLMVRHNAIPELPMHLVLLDTATAAYSGESFEQAVRVAASLCSATVRSGCSLRLRTTAGGAVDDLAEGRVSDRCDDVLDFLAGVKLVPGQGMEHLRDVLGGTEPAAVAVVTGKASAAVIDWLATNARRLPMFLIQVTAPFTAAAAPLEVVAMTAPDSDRFSAEWPNVVSR